MTDVNAETLYVVQIFLQDAAWSYISPRHFFERFDEAVDYLTEQHEKRPGTYRILKETTIRIREESARYE